MQKDSCDSLVTLWLVCGTIFMVLMSSMISVAVMNDGRVIARVDGRFVLRHGMNIRPIDQTAGAILAATTALLFFSGVVFGVLTLRVRFRYQGISPSSVAEDDRWSKTNKSAARAFRLSVICLIVPVVLTFWSLFL